MLEICKVKDKQAPILCGDEVVAVVSASNWKEEAVLTRGEAVWKLRSRKGKRLIGTVGHRSGDHRHRRTSTVPGRADIGLEGDVGHHARGNPIHMGTRVFLAWHPSRQAWRPGGRDQRYRRYLVDARHPRGHRRRPARSSTLSALDGVHPQPQSLKRSHHRRRRRRRCDSGQFMTATSATPARVRT